MKQAPEEIQIGSLRKVPRAKGKWAWEWRYIDPATGAHQSKYFAGEEYPNLSDIEMHLKPFVSRLNSVNFDNVIIDPTVGDLLDRYIAEERLLKIKDRKPGERAERKDDLAYATASSYLSLCKRVREDWGTTKLDKFKPFCFQNWLKALEVKPKTKGHLKAFVNRLFNKAKLYGMLEFHENPIGLVEVR
jgi:hypothetical protein